jgi:hypothetical protein
MAERKIRIKPDGRRAILKLTALAIVVSGLFPPWVFTFDKSGYNDEQGWHSQRNAGYACIFTPPKPHFVSNANGKVISTIGADGKDLFGDEFFAYFGVKLDLSRLLVEWVCIVAVSGAAWGLVRLEQVSEESKQP